MSDFDSVSRRPANAMPLSPKKKEKKKRGRGRGRGSGKAKDENTVGCRIAFTFIEMSELCGSLICPI